MKDLNLEIDFTKHIPLAVFRDAVLSARDNSDVLLSYLNTLANLVYKKAVFNERLKCEKICMDKNSKVINSDDFGLFEQGYSACAVECINEISSRNEHELIDNKKTDNMTTNYKFGTWYKIESFDKNIADEIMVYGSRTIDGYTTINFYIVKYDSDYRGGAKFFKFSAPGISCSVQPTHWMPLPNPPEDK